MSGEQVLLRLVSFNKECAATFWAVVLTVSKRWKDAASEARSRRLVKPGMTIMEVIEQARAGDTILLPPGYYPVRDDGCCVGSCHGNLVSITLAADVMASMHNCADSSNPFSCQEWLCWSPGRAGLNENAAWIGYEAANTQIAKSGFLTMLNITPFLSSSLVLQMHILNVLDSWTIMAFSAHLCNQLGAATCH